MYKNLNSYNCTIIDSESQQKFCLKWNQFSSHLKNTISNMRKADVLTDVTLMTEDGAKFTAHRIIMASASSFFRNDSTNKKSYFLSFKIKLWKNILGGPASLHSENS